MTSVALASTAGGVWTFAVALGIGLMIGLERERKRDGAPHIPAGVRTFALVGLLGGLARSFDDAAVLAVGVGFVAVGALASYMRTSDDDPGLTTEVALVVTFLLGALAYEEPQLAAGLAVAVTILLAARTRIHRFVASVLSERELHDGLIFAAAALVILPLVPDRSVGPYDVLNPFTIWRLVVLMMAISAVGYIARRALGDRFGLPVAGLAGGFVSASATVAAMGDRAKREPSLGRLCLAGALLANIATVSLLVILVGSTSLDTLRELSGALALSGLTTALVGGLATLRAARTGDLEDHEKGRAFDLRWALVFALTLSAVMLGAAALNDLLGSRGFVVGLGLAGFADAHSAAISAAALAAAGSATPHEAALAILAALSTNTVTKLVMARVSGTPRFLLGVTPGMVAMVAAAWVGFALVQVW